MGFNSGFKGLNTVFLGRAEDMRTGFRLLAGFLLWLQNWGLANTFTFSSTVKWTPQKTQQALNCVRSAYSSALFLCQEAKYITWLFEFFFGLHAVSHVLLTLLYFVYKEKLKVKGKGHPCTGTEVLYRPYGP